MAEAVAGIQFSAVFAGLGVLVVAGWAAAVWGGGQLAAIRRAFGLDESTSNGRLAVLAPPLLGLVLLLVGLLLAPGYPQAAKEPTGIAFLVAVALLVAGIVWSFVPRAWVPPFLRGHSRAADSAKPETDAAGVTRIRGGRPWSALLGALALIAAGVAVVRIDGSDARAWVAGAVPVLLGVVGLLPLPAVLARGSSVAFDDAGLTFLTAYAPVRVAWSDLVGVRPGSLGVELQLRDQNAMADAAHAAERLQRALFRVSEPRIHLPTSTLRIAPERLTRLIEDEWARRVPGGRPADW